MSLPSETKFLVARLGHLATSHLDRIHPIQAAKAFMRGGVKNDCTKDVKNDCTKDVYYKKHRFPAEIISHAVWLYFRFCLSFRDVEELLFERGVIVTSEVIRKWCRKFGQHYATQLRRRRPGPATNGTSVRCFSRSKASVTICGGRSIRRGTCWTSSCSASATRGPQRNSSASC